MAAFRLTPAARYSLKQIAVHTQKKWGAKQQKKYIKALDACFHDLAATPKKGIARIDIHPELRSYPCGKHIIYYLPGKKHIRIVHILHMRMDPRTHISN